ncbi:hypothetical protein [Clostridium aminobutyricum]|uniref:Uncharacterized protein n=1 Tax=Clostridium aminobutyricum TaxID=33953 RepID=A0A939IIA9_CLOAM|nr:hypothetical protein [Clostridium aminobutyricum]MBN7772304.1 hypothetical protein [Clostridium aminobutyricum]
MGLIEFIGELINPGEIGTIEKTKRGKGERLDTLIVKTIVSIVIVTVIYYLVFGISFHFKEFITFVSVMAVYSAAGYFISPKPDYSNVGWLGGIFDNPFRFSDDINRMLIFVMVILMPGRLISTTVLSWIDYSKKGDLL